MSYKDRIVGEGYEAPDQLLANPDNPKIHPTEQQQALDGLLSSVGWVGRVIVNRRTGYVVDGHARIMLAMRKGVDRIPVQYVDLSEEEERLVLSCLDPIGAMFVHDQQKTDELISEIQTGEPALQELLADLHTDLVPDEKEPEEKECCPTCGRAM